MSVQVRTTTLSGMNLYVSDALPLLPSFEEQIRRRVRHGLADVLEWLGEPVGPKPEDGTHAFQTADGLIVSQELLRTMQRQGLTAQISVTPSWTVTT